MVKEQSAGAVIFRIEKGDPRYLLLHYPFSSKAKKEYWDLPKGHIEKGESEEDTVRREVAEETGLRDVELLNDFRQEIHYRFQSGRQNILKTVVFYLAKTNQQKVTISSEHIGFQWLGYEEAIEKLTYANARQVVKKAHEFLKGYDVI